MRKRFEIKGLRALFSRWRVDASGTTAIEFGIVAMPFFLFVFGIVVIGLYFFTTFTLENAVERASRLIRTGQAQKMNMTDVQFKNRVCEYVPNFVNCENKLIINVRSYAEADLTPAVTREECLNEGSLTDITTYLPGAANQVVLVTLCYEWELANKLPFLRLGDMANGSRLIQASSAFRTEPYME